MLIHFDKTGPMIQYDEGCLIVSDLNPETMTRWKMSRMERFITGLRFILSCFVR
jgi:hypothetical protein